MPDDIAWNISGYLDARSLARVSGASKDLRQSFGSSFRSEYVILLERSGMDDGNTGRPSEELLNALRAYNEAWSILHWRFQYLVTLDAKPWVTEIISGCRSRAENSSLAFLGESGSFVYHAYPAGNSHERDGWSLDLYGLPSICAGFQGGHLSYHYPFEIRSVAICPSQNLLVVLENQRNRTRLHYYDLYHNTPHQRAYHSNRSVCRAGGIRFAVKQMEICGSMIGLLLDDAISLRTVTSRFEDHSTHIAIVNWQTGEKFDLDKFPNRHPVYWSFYFLDENKILVAELGAELDSHFYSNYLRLCDIKDTTHACDVVYDVTWSDDSVIFDNSTIFDISFVPNVSSRSNYPVIPNTPFYTKASEWLVGITIKSSPSHPPTHIRNRTLFLIKESSFLLPCHGKFVWKQDFMRCSVPGENVRLNGTRLLWSSTRYNGFHQSSTIHSKDFNLIASRAETKNNKWRSIPGCSSDDGWGNNNWRTKSYIIDEGPGNIHACHETVSCEQPYVTEILATENNLILFYGLNPLASSANLAFRVLSF